MYPMSWRVDLGKATSHQYRETLVLRSLIAPRFQAVDDLKVTLNPLDKKLLQVKALTTARPKT